MTVAGVARVGVISGQEQAKQEARLRGSSQNQAIHHLEDSDSAKLQDTVTLSGSGKRPAANGDSFSRYLEPENLRAIVAYEAIQPGTRLERQADAMPSDIPPEWEPAQEGIDIKG
jgi:hypothetical protein